MKNILRLILAGAVLLGGVSAFGQTDITGPTPGQTYAITPYLDLARGATWGGSGNVSTVNNSFVFTPVSTNTGTCLFVTNNNTTNAHTFTLEVAITGDSRETRFLNSTNPQEWKDVKLSGSETVNSPGTNFYYLPTTGAAKVAISFTGATTLAGSPDTANIYVTQGSNACASAVPSQEGSRIPGANAWVNMRPPLSCDQGATATVTTGTTSLLVTGSPGRQIAVCAYNIDGGGTTTTAAAIVFQSGTGATCAVGTSPRWSFQTTAGVGILRQLAMANGSLFNTLSTGNNLCIADNGTTTGFTVQISFAIVTNSFDGGLGGLINTK